MPSRAAIVALLVCAVVGDAAAGVLWPAAARPPLLPIAVVVAVAAAAGVRAGMVTGFATGLVLDLLSGPAAVAGVHALTALTVGTVAGWAQRDHRHPTAAAAALSGALGVTGAAVMFLLLQQSLDAAGGGTVDTVVLPAFAVGTVVTPLVQRLLRRSAGWPLSQTSART
jgi:rod shape-determining protein MreD